MGEEEELRVQETVLLALTQPPLAQKGERKRERERKARKVLTSSLLQLRHRNEGVCEPTTDRPSLGSHERSPYPRQPSLAASFDGNPAQTALCVHHRPLVC